MGKFILREENVTKAAPPGQSNLFVGTDHLFRTIDDTGTIHSYGGGGPVTTIYTGDGQLAGDRIVDLHGQILQFQDSTFLGNRFFYCDPPNGNFYFGDIDGHGNGSDIEIDDNTPQVRIKVPGSTVTLNSFVDRFSVTQAGQSFVLDNQNSRLVYASNAGRFLLLDRVLNIYQLGDIDGGNNNSKITVDDANKVFKFDQGVDYLKCDVTNALYQMGDIAGVHNATRMSINDNFLSLQVLIEAQQGLKITGDTKMIHSGTSYTDGAAAQAGTLLNAPAAGNPTKWIPVDDNGVIRFIPAW